MSSDNDLLIPIPLLSLVPAMSRFLWALRVKNGDQCPRRMQGSDTLDLL